VSEGIRGIQQHDIQITVQRQMLKTIVEDDYLRAKVVTGISTAPVAVLANKDGDSREGTSQEIGLIPCRPPVEERTMVA
jgi:hypothetical protein